MRNQAKKKKKKVYTNKVHIHSFSCGYCIKEAETPGIPCFQIPLIHFLEGVVAGALEAKLTHQAGQTQEHLTTG